LESNNMNIKEYLPCVRQLINPLGDVQKDRLHMAMGMVGEIGEVVDLVKKRFAYGREVEDIKILEELGDFVFYTVGLADMAGIDLATGADDPGALAMDEQMLMAALALQSGGVLYGMSAHDPQLQAAVVDELPLIFEIAGHLARRLGSSLEEVLDINIRKLSVRYPNLTFDTDRANNRDVAAEQEAMRA
jgi:NTP pyrophosphatase (non-canonical NTP hydrolase)